MMLTFCITMILITIFVLIQKSASDSNITCYVCYQEFPNNQLFQFDDCLKPNSSDSQLVPITCNPFEDTCMVKRIAKNGITSAIRRACATSDDCSGDRGCKFTNYGITTWECTSCCSTPACNTDNKANNFKDSFYLLYLIIIYFIIF